MNRSVVLSKRALFAFPALALVAALACGGPAGELSLKPTRSAAVVRAGFMRVHYWRQDGAYGTWAVYSWTGPLTPSSGWPGAPRWTFDAADPDGWGRYADVELAAGATQFQFLINDPAGNKACSDMSVGIASAAAGAETWVIDGECSPYTAEPGKGPKPDDAVWLDRATLAWPKAPADATGLALYVSASAALSVGSDGAVAGTPDAVYPLQVIAGGLSAAQRTAFPQYASALALSASLDDAALKRALQGQLLVGGASGGYAFARPVQLAPVLDDVYAAGAKALTLGPVFDRFHRLTAFRLWAPTAQDAQVNLYLGGAPGARKLATRPMTRDAASGAWTYAPGWWEPFAGLYYTYTVKVFTRATGRVETNEVTDPYSVSLNGNSQRSQALDLGQPLTMPDGWTRQPLPPTSAHPTESVVYELHVRDFSATDRSVPAALRGKYLAFALDGGAGARHLRGLAEAGLTHVHLLPAFDFATVDELTCDPGATLPPIVPEVTGASLDAQAVVVQNQAKDCFNWGYDPFHYGAPEGSYATDPGEGSVRVREFRRMVQALHRMGLRVVMDVVYNHTDAAGQSAKSVLDRIVPGYYHRLGPTGSVLTESCCSDTAPEHAMMEKLMTDTLVRWADAYKVDGFRFDIMGFIPRAAVLRARDAVDAVAARDGRGHTYFYGEGWNSGSVANDALFPQATQLGLQGTGVGTFNDRMRDAVRGGGPFDSGAAMVQHQGFVSGLCWDDNGSIADPAAKPDCSSSRSTSAFLGAQDRLEVSLAGNLAGFVLRGGVTGWDLDYGGQHAGYTGTPQENVAYVSAHDNETVWDVSQYKHPAAATPAERARAQVVAISLPVLSQGVGFIHAGDELLRSKSEDGNSYDSGDYFNRIDWDGSSNGWAMGAPPQNTGNNQANLAQIQAVFANPNAAAGPREIRASARAFADLLRVRRSTSLLHLATAEEVQRCVRFPDQGLGQAPGVVVMQVGDGTTACGDGAWKSAVVVFNAGKAAASVAYPWYVHRRVALHPALASGADPVVRAASFDGASGTFTVPPRTTAVFVERAGGAFASSYPAMNLRGSMNGWGNPQAPMKLVADHLWQVSVVLPAAAYEFKFVGADSGWDPNWGDDGADGLGDPGGANVKLDAAAAGTYVFQFDDASKAIRVLGPGTVPGVPAGVAAVITGGSARVTWSAAPGAVRYQVLRREAGSADGTVVARTFDTAAVDAVPDPSKTYEYAVSASNGLFAATSVYVAATRASGFASSYPSMNVIGSFTSGWGAAAALALVADHLWSVTLAVPAGHQEFKLRVDPDSWSNNDQIWGVVGAPVEATSGTLVTNASQGGNAGNVAFASAGGSYTLTFDDQTFAYAIAPAP